MTVLAKVQAKVIARCNSDINGKYELQIDTSNHSLSDVQIVFKKLGVNFSHPQV